MLAYGMAIVAAALIPLITRGSYKRLLRTEIHWGWLLATGLGVQIVLEYVTMPREYWHSVGFGLLVASYVLILAFCARNLVLRGMGIVFIGIACNALAIGLNQGMPVKFPPEWRNQTWAEATVKHHPQEAGERLLILSDIIILKHPYDVVLSFGDLIIAVGICDVSYNASRNPRKRRRKARRAAEPRTRRSAPPDREPASLEAASLATIPADTPPALFAPAPDLRRESAARPYESIDDFTPKARASHRS
jgi:hypothetical protein